MPIPIYINNFNRLTTTKNLVSYFQSIPDAYPIIVDNRSTYPPLLNWYEDCPCDLIILPKNFGHHAPWDAQLILPLSENLQKFSSAYYAVTDSDLDFTDVPKDVLTHCIRAFLKYPHYKKVGVSLEIKDIPEENRKSVQQDEHAYWGKPVSPANDFYDAPIDTTFCVYPSHLTYEKAQHLATPTLRANRPYTAKHVPWYLTKDNLTEEEVYYFKHSNASNTFRPKCLSH